MMGKLPALALVACLAAACSSPPASDRSVARAPAPVPSEQDEPGGDLDPADQPGATAPAPAEEPPAEGAAGDAAMDPAYRFESFPLDDYPLDSQERVVGSRGKLACPEVETVVYKGDLVRYHRPVRVYVHFRDRLRKFEQVVRDVATEVYGRAPVRIHHLGTYVCRRMKGDYKDFISEHAFANAIDVAGFEFRGASKAERAAAPKGLRGGFTVTVDRHWRGGTGKAEVHARFLRLLIERLAARADVFRVMLGPGYPNHDDHFHFDASVFRLIDLEGYGR